MRLLIFTCRRDWDKAALAVRTVPPEWSVAYVVEPGDADLPRPEGVGVVVREFSRGVNLSGNDGVLGVVDVLADQSSQFGRIGKMDSDCLLVRPDFLLEGEVAGQAHGRVPLAVYGLAYALSPKAAQRAAKGLKRAVGLGCSLLAEDACITTTANTGEGDALLPLGAFWDSPHQGTLPPAGTAAIHCGDTRYVQRASPQVAQEMRRLGDALGLWRR